MDAIATTCEPGHDFLARGGDLGRLISGFDWTNTPLGPVERWPDLIKTTVGLMVRSPVPMVALWGPEGIMIYNDAYAVIAANRHPALLGSKVLEGWPEAVDLNDYVMRTVLGVGETLSYDDQELTLYRNGRPEQLWFNLDYSPIVDEMGARVGVLAIVVETTAKVRAERRLSGERKRLERMFDQAPGFMALLEGPEHVFAMANRAYSELVGDRELLGRRVADALPEVADQGFVELLDGVYSTGESYVGRGTPVQLQRTDDIADERFVDFIFQPVLDDGGITGIFVQGHDVTERKRSERQQELLLGELNHRVKNSLAVVQSLAHQSFRSSVDPAEAIRRFEGRLEALATAHGLLTRTNWESATIAEVVNLALAPFCSNERREVVGPDVWIPPQTAVSLALALHELATNAAKYGALSNDAGRISVEWIADHDRLELSWRERGGPHVTAPERRGFGTRMIERTLAVEFGARVDLSFHPEGVVCTLSAPLPSRN